MQRIGLTSLALFGVTIFAASQGGWDRPSSEWSKETAEKMLEDSPWAKQISFRLPTPADQEKDPSSQEHVYTIRLFSAYPVQAAYLRLLQISQGYSDLSADERGAFDRRYPVQVGDRTDRIVINLDCDSSDRQSALEIDRQLKQYRTPEIKNLVFLSSSTFERVDLQEYSPPSPDGTGAKFIFPRTVDGVDVASASESSYLEFEFVVPGTDHRIIQTWHLDDLRFRGSTAF